MDEDRLELDEHGRVLGATTVVDLDRGEDLATTPVQRWVDDVAAPWLGRHRRAVRATAVVAAVGLVGGLWWSSRPPEVVPTFAVDLDNAVLAGNSIGGPEISPDGVLSVAFVATGRDPAETVTITGITGPGLTAAEVVASPLVTDGLQARVELRATVDCADPALSTAASADYVLAAEARTAGGTAPGTVPLVREGDRPVTRLDRAVLDWCLASLAPSAVAVDDVATTPVPGTTLVDVAVTVRNLAPVPLTMTTSGRVLGGIAVDRSPTSTVEPGASAVLPTRVDVLDCLTAPALPALSSLPNAADTSSSAAGLPLLLGLGDRIRVASYAVPSGTAVAQGFAQVCAGAGSVDVGVRGTDLRRDGDGWSGTVDLALRTVGVGVTAGLERFADPGTGASGPVLVTEGEGWAIPPSSMSGGAGGLPVAFSGASCRDVAGLTPTTVPLRVLMADGTVVPYAVPVDDIAVLRAVARACGTGVGPGVEGRGWRAAP